ncbi:MAG TPA: hypothetical protein VGE93_20330, partial [Bryobacteraceae bacterium]
MERERDLGNEREAGPELDTDTDPVPAPAPAETDAVDTLDVLSSDVTDAAVTQHADSSSSTTTWRIYRYNGAEMLEQKDTIATEAPLTIKIDGEEFATLVCTPTDVVELVTGFLA